MSFHHLCGLDRREFLHRMTATAAAGLAHTTSVHGHVHAPGQAQHGHAALPSTPVWRHRGHIPIFDAHLHVPGSNGEHWQRHPVTPTLKTFVDYLDYCGVERGIINSVRSQVASNAHEMLEGNREVLLWADRYSGRFAPACIVMPQYLDESLREIEDWKNKYGCVWIGELCNYVSGYRYDTPAFDQIMRLTTRLGMIIQIHARDDEMEYLVQKYPGTRMVFPHIGVGPRLVRRVELIGSHAYACLEISATGHDVLGGVEYAVRHLGADRVLFGSDFSINDPSAVIAQLDDSRLSSEEKERIFQGNVERLLAQAGYEMGSG